MKLLIFLLLGGALTFAAIQPPAMSIKNNSTTPLADGATYTGAWEDVEQYPRVKASVYTDQPGLLKLQFSSDKATVMSERAFPVEDSIEISSEAIRKWVRLVYTDTADGNAQTVFNVKMKTDHGSDVASPNGGSLRLPSESDAFGRLRVSDTDQRLDVEFIYDKQPDFFDEITNSGTVTHSTTSRDLTLSLGDAINGSYAWMKSHPIPYTPGNSQLIDVTGVLDLAAIGGGTAEFFLRSTVTGSTTTETVEQSAWESLSGSSDLDWSKAHIFSMDFQSLKVGTIRFGMVKNGSFIKVGQINNDNKRNSGYWQLPNLPVSYRLYNEEGFTYAEIAYGDDKNAVGFRYKMTANASAQMKAICVTVKSEGGGSIRGLAGLPKSVDQGVTAKTVSTTIIPLISIRATALFNAMPNNSLIIPKTFNVLTDQSIRLILYHNPTLTGASWVPVDGTGSGVEYDVSASAIAGGDLVDAKYVFSGGVGTNSGAAGSGLLGKTYLWNRAGAETGILTLAAVRTGTTNADVLGSIHWEEIR